MSLCFLARHSSTCEAQILDLHFQHQTVRLLHRPHVDYLSQVHVHISDGLLADAILAKLRHRIYRELLRHLRGPAARKYIHTCALSSPASMQLQAHLICASWGNEPWLAHWLLSSRRSPRQKALAAPSRFLQLWVCQSCNAGQGGLVATDDTILRPVF